MNEPSRRCFLAADLPDDARAQALEAIERLRAQLPAGVRWVQAKNLHLTLKFLGGISAQRIASLEHRVHAKLAGMRPFRVELAGIGAFPNARHARVLWLGGSLGSSELARLARKLDAAAVRIGVEREHRPYRPHLTLGRLKEPAAVPLGRVESPGGVPFFIEEIVLYESQLSSTGPEYVPLARFPLPAAAANEASLAPEI